MFSFNIILTELCNASCSHCYMAGNKSKKTMTKEQIDIIVEKMPKNTKSIVFTGGEIFLVFDLVLYSIDTVKIKFPNIIIGLESNGIILYKNLEKAKEKLQILKQKGVSFIRFSDDPFHESGGVNLDSVRNLKKLEKEVGLEIKFLVQNKAVAIGNAANLDGKYKEKKNCMNNKNSINNPYIFLDVSGDVYICTWKCIPPIGNMITDSWDKIISELQCDFYYNILSGNIIEAFDFKEKSMEKKNSNIKYAKENGQCMLCNKKFLD